MKRKSRILNPAIDIIEVGGLSYPNYSFISNQQINVVAEITNLPTSGFMTVTIQVQGKRGASGNNKTFQAFLSGNHATLNFLPNQMVFNRPTGGASSPNETMVFDFKAALNLNSSIIAESGWSSLDGLDIDQDNIDIFRQEYLDFGASPVPSRSEVVSSLGPPWNGGNYSVQLNNSLQSQYSTIQSNYANALVLLPNGQPALFNGKKAHINNGSTVITSAFRCPRKNIAVGSQFPVSSKHVWGRALDIKPNLANGTTEGGSAVVLNLHQHLYPTLLKASSSVGTAICEAGSAQVPAGSPNEDHVHVQW